MVMQNAITGNNQVINPQMMNPQVMAQQVINTQMNPQMNL